MVYRIWYTHGDEHLRYQGTPMVDNRHLTMVDNSDTAAENDISSLI